jgi:gas vesicle protein
MRRVFSFLEGFMIGGLIGAVAAIMFAPISGNQARSELLERSNRIREGIKEIAETRRAELERELTVLRTPYRKG